MASNDQAQSSVEEQIQQLGAARALVLTDPIYWAQILHGILPIVSGPVVELRRWGADFLAETFSTPVVDINEKQSLAVTCLDTMVRLMDEKEAGILKSVVQCSASVYPLIFRYMYVLLLRRFASRPTRSTPIFPVYASSAYGKSYLFIFIASYFSRRPFTETLFGVFFVSLFFVLDATTEMTKLHGTRWTP